MCLSLLAEKQEIKEVGLKDKGLEKVQETWDFVPF